jgi:autotransporter passenger strand-loop-strand repeat protein
MADYSTTFSATLTGGHFNQQLTFVGSTTLDFSVASGGTVSGTADFQVTDPTFFDVQVSGTSPVSGTTSDIQTSDQIALDGGGFVDISFDGQLSADGTEVIGSATIAASGTADGNFPASTFSWDLVVPPASSGEIVSGGEIVEVTSGSVVSNVTVLSGGELAVASGGTASASTVSNGGVEDVLSDGTDVNVQVNSGGIEVVNSGGQAFSATVNNGGSEFISSGGVAQFTTVSSGGVVSVGNGGELVEGIVSSGGLVYDGGRTSGPWCPAVVKNTSARAVSPPSLRRCWVAWKRCLAARIRAFW